MNEDLMHRIQVNAEHLIQTYPTANALLKSAVQGAMPWAGALVTKGAVPPLDRLETLATQLLAILMASQPDTIKPVKGFGR